MIRASTVLTIVPRDKTVAVSTPLIERDALSGKFYDYWVPKKSPVAKEAIDRFGAFYEIEAKVIDSAGNSASMRPKDQGVSGSQHVMRNLSYWALCDTHTHT